MTKVNADKWVWLMVSLFVVATITTFQYANFILGKQTFFHDSFLSITCFHLVLNPLLEGYLPLWSPETGSGEPLWPFAETIPFIDPIPLSVYAIGKAFNISTVYCYLWTCILWHLALAVGAFAVSQKLWNQRLMGLAVAVLMIGGPLGAATVVQSGGYLFPFRYVPLTLLAMIWFLESPSFKRAFWLGMAGGLHSSSFQTIYSALYLVAFLSGYLWVARGFRREHLKHYGIAIGTAILFMSPSIVGCWEFLKMATVNRDLVPKPHLYELGRFWVEILSDGSGLNGWHGVAYVGWVPLTLALFGVSAVLTGKHIPRQTRAIGMGTLASLILTLLWFFGLHRVWGDGYSFLGLRNWGFTLVGVLLSLCWLAVVGAKQVHRFTSRRGSYWYLIPFVLFLLSRYLPAYAQPPWHPSDPKVHWTWGILAVALTALCFRKLPTKIRGNALVLTALIFLICYADMLRFSRTYRYWNSRSAEVLATAPPLSYQESEFASIREYTYPAGKFSPNFFMPPRLYKTQYATMPYWTKRDGPIQYLTHMLTLKRYQFVRDQVPMDIQREIFGVDLPIVRLVSNLHHVPDLKKAKLALETTSLQTTTLVESAPFPLGSKTGSFRVNDYQSNRVQFHVEGEEAQFLVYADGYDRHWKAYLNGKPTEIFPTNIQNKGVRIPPGSHELEFRYQPTAYLIAFWVRNFLLALGTLLGIKELLPAGKRKKDQSEELSLGLVATTK